MKLVESETEKKIRETPVSSTSYVFGNLIILAFLERMFGRSHPPMCLAILQIKARTFMLCL